MSFNSVRSRQERAKAMREMQETVTNIPDVHSHKAKLERELTLASSDCSVTGVQQRQFLKAAIAECDAQIAREKQAADARQREQLRADLTTLPDTNNPALAEAWSNMGEAYDKDEFTDMIRRGTEAFIAAHRAYQFTQQDIDLIFDYMQVNKLLPHILSNWEISFNRLWKAGLLSKPAPAVEPEARDTELDALNDKIAQIERQLEQSRNTRYSGGSHGEVYNLKRQLNELTAQRTKYIQAKDRKEYERLLNVEKTQELDKLHSEGVDVKAVFDDAVHSIEQRISRKLTLDEQKQLMDAWTHSAVRYTVTNLEKLGMRLFHAIVLRPPDME